MTSPNRFRSTGGLLFVTAALSSLLLSLPSASTAWTPPNLVIRRTHARHAAIPSPSAVTHLSKRMIGNTSPPPYHTSSLSMSSTASSPEQQRPLGEEGDWAAYYDGNYGRVYYFNHGTGETAWDPPTPTFPVTRVHLGTQSSGGPGGMERDNDGGGVMEEMNDPRMGGNGPTQASQNPQAQNPQQQQPQQQNQQSQQQPQQQQSQQQQPTFYQTLQVPPTASPSQIKQSYLALAKLYDARMEGGRRSKEFSEIARAWMVLSDGRLRERYDRQLEQWQLERRMREKMMAEEQQWVEEQQEQQQEQSMMGNGNKFQKDYVYKKKMEGDDGTNKFGKFRGQPQGGTFGARPLEVDEEAEAMNFQQAQQQAQYAAQMSAQQQQQAQEQSFASQQQMMEAQRLSLLREKQQLQEQALEEKQRVVEERKREERRRMSSERDVIQDQPRKPVPGVGWQQPKQPMGQQQPPQQSQQPPQPQQPVQQDMPQQDTPQPPGGQPDMNAMMANMKQQFVKFEAERVQDDLSRLQGKDGGMQGNGDGGRQGAGTDNTAPSTAGQDQDVRTTGGTLGSVLFPGKGGIVVEDSAFIAKDVLIDEFMKRPPSFISWVPPKEGTEGNAAADVRAAMGNTVQNDVGGVVGGNNVGGATGGPTATRPSTGPAVPISTLSGEREREQERLQKLKSMGMGMGKQQQQQPTGGKQQRQQQPGGSSKAREQARLQGMKAMGQPAAAAGRRVVGQAAAPGGSSSSGSGTVERSTLGGGMENSVAKTSAREREQRRLQGMKAMGQPAGAASTAASGIGGPTNTKQPPTPTATANSNILQLQQAHREEMQKLKSEMENAASQTLEEEIIKIAKIHAGEITKLKADFEAESTRIARGGSGAGQNGAGSDMEVEQLKMQQAAQRDRMKQEITQEVLRDQADKITRMQAAHQAQMEQLSKESSGGSDDEAAMERLQSEMNNLKQSQVAQLKNMDIKHSTEMKQLRTELESQSTELTNQHQSEIQKMQQDQKAASVADTLRFQEVAMDKLNGRHQDEIQGMVEQHDGEMDQLRKELEDRSAKDMEVRVAQVAQSLGAQYKADMDNMAAQHKVDVKKFVQSELQTLQKEHAREMHEAYADKRRLAQQAESVTRELKQAEEQGDNTMTKNQKIEMVLQSFEGVYDPTLIEQVRNDVQAREVELNKQISASKEQISSLQSRLDTSTVTEEKLNNDIQTLTNYKDNAQAELQRVQQGSNEKNKEVLTLNQSIQSMTTQITELKAQLDLLGKERDTGRIEIWELREWKKNAEVERERLEKELKSRDGVIAKLKFDYKERDEDVNFLVPEVGRLQELTATLEQLNEKRSKDFESLKQEAERLKSHYEKGSQSAADMTQSLQGQLSAEQSKNTQSITNLHQDLKAKEDDMSKLQSTASERSRTILDMKLKLEEYRKESERAVEESKKKMASMSAGFERELAQGKTVHKAELEQLGKKLQRDIQRLQQDLNSRSNTITDLKTRLDESSASNKKLSGEIVGFGTQRRSTEALLKQSSHDLDVTKQEVGRLQKQIQAAQQYGAANTVQIQALERELTEKSAVLHRLQTGATQFASEKERLLEDLNTLRQWKDSAQDTINALSNEVAQNVLSEDIIAQTGDGGATKIDNVIAKLSGIQNELNQKDAQLGHAKSATEALLEKGQMQQQSGDKWSVGNVIETRSSPPSPPDAVAGGFLAIKAVVPNASVIDGGFTSRHRNVAPMGKNKFTSIPRNGAGSGAVPERNTVTPTAPAKPQSPTNTMGGYDATLAGAQQTENETMPDAGKGVTTTFPSTPHAAGAGASTKPQSSNTMNAYDAALSATQKEKPTTLQAASQTTPTAQYAADEYRKAEKQFLMEAKNLGQVAAKSFSDARGLKGGWNKTKYNNVLARANKEMARVDELLAKANEMKEKAEQSSFGP